MARTIIGFHYSTGGNKTGIGDFMRKLNAAKIPFLLKGTDDAALCFECQELGKAEAVENHIIYRVSTAGQRRRGDFVEYDVPDYLKSPRDAAQEHFDKTAVKWPSELNKSLVWMEPVNKPLAKVSRDASHFQNMHPVDWLGQFMLAFAKIANKEGFKVCGPSFNSGEPEVFASPDSATGNDYEQPGMLAYLRYCAENPTKAALSVHEYVWDLQESGQQWAEWYPHLWGRVEAALAAADNNRIPRDFAIYVTEWGFSATHAPRWPDCQPHLTAYNQWAARWPQLKGVAAWSLQGGWGSVDNDLQSWFGPLADYAVSREFDPGSQPAVTHPSFGSTYPGQPQPKGTPAANRYYGPPVTFVAGLHGPGGAYSWHGGGFQNMMRHLNTPVKLMANGDPADKNGENHKPALDLVRVFWSPDSPRQKTARQAWEEDIRDGVMDFYNKGARNFEVHNEFSPGKRGRRQRWRSGAEFGDFLRQLMLIIRENCPEARLWYPGESPGLPWTNQFGFSREAFPMVADLCYGICQYAYSGNTADVGTAVREIVDQVRQFRQGIRNWDKPIIVSECSLNRAATPKFRAEVYCQVQEQLARIPGVQGVYWNVSHSNPPETERANAGSWYGIHLPICTRL